MKANLLIHMIPRSELKEIKCEAKRASSNGTLFDFINNLKAKYSTTTKEVYELTFYATHI